MDIRECIENLIEDSMVLVNLLEAEASGNYDSGYCTECITLELDVINCIKRIGRFKEIWLK